ncbi:MAG: AmmeMemoRadiSam system protein A [Anaerolineae bacterium]|nr:AmmeMemoRadiSam system protein A [Anaerolineae bacterium]MDW8070397.1 AmmeMemoRadiSam system protein A [Anaerolineae bacterium]
MGTSERAADTPVLTASEKKTLLRIARETLKSYLQTGKIPHYTFNEPGLLQKAAAFVTLHRRNGELRGCIGRIEVTEPLYRTVQECAISAATRDYRFQPVRNAAELDDLIIEISVLSPFRRVQDLNEIEVGKHGLLIRQGYNSGLLLPQVASERGWSREEFLRAVCMKAGLPSDAWRHAELHVFTAEVFSEKDRTLA